MLKRVYFGNLLIQTPKSEVRKFFEQFGPVRSVSVITDRETGRSKGLGYVEMNDDDVLKAIAGLDGMELHGRQITVNAARPPVRRSSSAGADRMPY